MGAATVHVSADDLRLTGAYESVDRDGELVATLADGRQPRLGRRDVADLMV
jgi:hypothetical protein